MLSGVVGSCCVRFETGQTFNYFQTDATSPNIIGPTMLGVVGLVLAVVRKRCNNPEQCWANNVGSCCVRLLVVLGFSGQNANISSQGLLGLRA